MIISGENEEIIIFFDTNFLEVRHDGNRLFLSELKVSKDYYDLVNFMKINALQDKLELSIPEVVWREMKEHLLTSFRNESKSLISTVELYNKTFGGMLNLTYSLSFCKDEEYIEYIEKLAQDFLANNSCKIAPYPREDAKIDTIVTKAIKSQKPFMKVKGNKDYSDAGFKDALITETIIEYCRVNQKRGYFFTKDHDFEDVFNPITDVNVEIINDIEKGKILLSKVFRLENVSEIKYRFQTNSYLKESVFEATGQKYDESVTKFVIINIDEISIDSIYNIEINCIYNETEYQFIVEYDFIANEVIKAIYELKNE
jgi:hypothetical protein